MLNISMAALYLFFLSAAAVWDFRFLRIPNWISVSLFCLFFIYISVLENNLNVTHHLAIAAATFALGFFLYTLRWLSAGDVKLITAVAIWAGPTDIIPLLLVTTLIGGLLGITIILLIKARRSFSLSRVFSLDSHLPRWAKRGVVPYGIAIVGGALWLVPIRF